MNIDLTFLGVGIGGVLIGHLAPKIAAAFRQAAPGATKILTELPEKIEKATIARWGIQIPAEWHYRIDEAMRSGVAWAESIFSSPDFWKSLLYILKGNPKLISDRAYGLLLEWIAKGSPADAVPQEVKPLLNTIKEDQAVKVVKGELAAILPADMRPTDEQIRADVAAMAPAAGRTIMPALGVGTNRPPEVQAEIEKLRGKVATDPFLQTR
jgi:hypothetical protein